MRPAPRPSPLALKRRLRPLSLTVLAAALVVSIGAGLAAPAHAQDTGDAAAPPADRSQEQQPGGNPAEPPADTSEPESVETSSAAISGPIAFEADRVEYAENADTITAIGTVVLRRGDQSVRADNVTWNRNSGQIVAAGDVRIVDQDGNQLFTDRIELTDELKAGAMENLLLAMREGGRLAAENGRRSEDGTILLERAAYTGCAVETPGGCPKEPTWRITAREVEYDPDARRVRFKGARLQLFNLISVPVPGLAIRTDGGASSGFLIPDFRFTPSNGVEISESYYVRLADNRDLTATAYVYTKVPPMASLQYRALTDKGAYQVTGYATQSSRIPIFGTEPSATNAFRGYIFANGRYQIDQNWSVTGSLRRASDRTFLRRYDISRDDRLRSMIDVERISNRTFLSIAGWATQTMRVGDRQGQVPVALPAIDFRHRLPDGIFGGRVELQANTLGILRSSGQDTQRGFASARWDMRRITGLGQEVTFTALARGDVYHSDENELTETEIYRGNPGWQGRAVAVGAVDVKWPLVGRFLGGTQVLTPRLQLVASPRIRNLAVPNEDARAIDLEDSNLFALNRFPGYDRIEDSVRFTYGLDWQLERPNWRVKANIGQSVRLSRRPTLLPDGTGLSSRTSDIVGRTEIRFKDFINLTHRFRIDKDSLAVRRNEFDATIGSYRTYAEVGYVKLNRDITDIEDLQDREELRFAGRVAFANYWSVFGSAVVNLTSRSDDPEFGSDGFQPLRTRLGLAYEDDCLELGLTWRRDYQPTGDARRGNSFQIHFALRNIGVR